MDTVKVCEVCGSENVMTAGDGGMGFCEDCDAPCSTVEVSDAATADVGDYVRCSMCEEVIHVDENTLSLGDARGIVWYCEMCA